MLCAHRLVLAPRARRMTRRRGRCLPKFSSASRSRGARIQKLMRKRMLRAWLLWLLAAACCALAFIFTHAGPALAALCVPVLAALAGLVVLRCSRLPALSAPGSRQAAGRTA